MILDHIFNGFTHLCLCVEAAANRVVLVPNLRRWRRLRLDQAFKWVGVVIGPRRLVHWLLVSWLWFVVKWLRFMINWLQFLVVRLMFVMIGEHEVVFPRWLRLRCVVDLRECMRGGLGVDISSPVSGSCDNQVHEQGGFERLHLANVGASD